MTMRLQELVRGPVVPILTFDQADGAAEVGAAIAEGGLLCAEVTLRTAASLRALRALASGSGLIVGAGTVLSAEQVDEAVDAGASFVVSPGSSQAVVERCEALGLPLLPGVATATEIQAMLRQGLTTMKLFPAAWLGGPHVIGAFGGPFPMVDFVPTGGIAAADAPGYLALPQVLAVGGSWIAPRDLIRQMRLEEIAARSAAAADLGGAHAHPSQRTRGG